MTDTNRLPAIEALGEALALIQRFAAFADEAESEATAHGCTADAWGKRVPWELLDRARYLRLLLTPGPTVNAGEEGTDAV